MSRADRPRADAARRRFYAGVAVLLAACLAGAVTLVVLGLGAGGGTRVAMLAGAVVLLVAAYALTAVIKISRAGDPER